DPIPFSHPPTRHHLRHGSVQHGLPAAMCTCADSGLGGAADKRYLLDVDTPADLDEARRLQHVAALAQAQPPKFQQAL
ncbi:MAG: hypothetical protein ACKOF9_07130, partial [Burkholderiales bacterium]